MAQGKQFSNGIEKILISFAFFVLCTALLVAWFALLVVALQESDPCFIDDHENNNGSYGPHESDCTLYLQCQASGYYAARSCAPGLHWNREEQACDWPENSNCVEFDTEQRNEVNGPCNVGDHADNSGMYVPHPTDCVKYLQCLHGRFGARDCPEGTHWNAEKGACDWPQKANCRIQVNQQPNYPQPPVQYI